MYIIYKYMNVYVRDACAGIINNGRTSSNVFETTIMCVIQFHHKVVTMVTHTLTILAFYVILQRLKDVLLSQNYELQGKTPVPVLELPANMLCHTP